MLRMREPVFTETMQISIVVRDLEKTLRTYVEEYGISPWEIYEFNPSTVTEMTTADAPGDYRFRIAVTMVGSVQWELVQPLEDKGVFAEFLATKGEGVHHVAVGGREYRETLEALRAKGHGVLQGGHYNGVTFAYVSTDPDLGVITEIFDWPEGLTQEPDAVYPPASQ
jgi:methylmalonyl-CoA/ethylmalonyl-CoA epimerase